MTQLDIDKQQDVHEIALISKADRHALLKMIAEKPSVLINSALQNAAQRGLFTDPLLITAPPKSFLSRAFKSLMLVALLAIIGWAIFVGTRQSTTLFQAPRSVMEAAPSDLARTVPQKNDKKEEIVLSRFSESVRNAVKNYVPEPGSDVNSGNTTFDGRCTLALKRRAIDKAANLAADKGLTAQRPNESVDNWIKRMTSLKDAGKITELQDEAIKFHRAYPGISLPKTLQAATCID
jgi:hypothetical protein